jgi:hypothetical protein
MVASVSSIEGSGSSGAGGANPRRGGRFWLGSRLRGKWKRKEGWKTGKGTEGRRRRRKHVKPVLQVRIRKLERAQVNSAHCIDQQSVSFF